MFLGGRCEGDCEVDDYVSLIQTQRVVNERELPQDFFDEDAVRATPRHTEVPLDDSGLMEKLTQATLAQIAPPRVAQSVLSRSERSIEQPALDAYSGPSPLDDLQLTAISKQSRATSPTTDVFDEDTVGPSSVLSMGSAAHLADSVSTVASQKPESFSGQPLPITAAQPNLKYTNTRESTTYNAGTVSPFVEQAPVQDCTPTCRWGCDSPVCDEVCEPVCEAPKCETRCGGIDTSACSMDCTQLSCAVICPERKCPNKECQHCVTKCSEPQCLLRCPSPQPCHNVCEEPACEWRCKAPTDCPTPKCQMTCEKPKNCLAHDLAPLPALPADGSEVRVTNFQASVGMDLANGEAEAGVITATKPCDETEPARASQMWDGSQTSISNIQASAEIAQHKVHPPTMKASEAPTPVANMAHAPTFAPREFESLPMV